VRAKIVYLSFVVLLGVSSTWAQSSTDAPAPKATQTQIQDVQQNLKDILFDFDSADLRPQDQATLQANAQWLKAHPDVMVTIEGDADERGDIVYNVVLSDKRAAAARDALVEMGVPANQIAYATGWGKLYPVCQMSDEPCWEQNRRSHFAAW
jgi:peptidoglycan-associated lipoprotein